MYIGKLVWHRQRFIKDPDAGKRQARPNPESEWVIQDAPELRIVEDDLWSTVKGRQKTVTHHIDLEAGAIRQKQDRRSSETAGDEGAKREGQFQHIGPCHRRDHVTCQSCQRALIQFRMSHRQ